MINYKADQKRKLAQKYSQEYSKLLSLVIEKRCQISVPNSNINLNTNPKNVERVYVARILDKLMIEIELFVDDCDISKSLNCKYCT
jgi:hypothetical protein